MLGNYLAASLRNLQRNGVYAAMTVTGLAIAFASAILIGLYLRHELTYDQFIPGHERVFLVSQTIVLHESPKSNWTTLRPTGGGSEARLPTDAICGATCGSRLPSSFAAANQRERTAFASPTRISSRHADAGRRWRPGDRSGA